MDLAPEERIRFPEGCFEWLAKPCITSYRHQRKHGSKRRQNVSPSRLKGILSEQQERCAPSGVPLLFDRKLERRRKVVTACIRFIPR